MMVKKWLLIWWIPILWLWTQSPQSSVLPDRDTLELSVTRYRKGLELQRLIYEKLLELDQYYQASLADFRQPMVQRGTLPNEASQAGNWSLEGLLALLSGEVEDGYPLASPGWTWLDLYWDVKGFLRGAEELHVANSLLEEDCRMLFASYTSFLGYEFSLPECRSSDDWDTLENLLAAYEAQCRADRIAGRSRAADLAHINLEFAVDRLLELLADYRLDIRRGRIHYRHYVQILSRYLGGSPSSPDRQWLVELIGNMDHSHLKYTAAYDLAELEGSRLKDLLYGFE